MACGMSIIETTSCSEIQSGSLMRGLLPNAVERDAAAFTSVAAGLAMPGVTEAAITS